MKTWPCLLTILLLPAYLLAQPTIESAVPFFDNADLATYTTGTITVPNVPNRGIGICITSGEHGSDPNFTSPPTYSLGGGQVFTEIVSSGDEGQPTAEDFVTLWYLVNPTVGTTGTITWTHTSTLASGAATIFVLSGAAQSNPTVAGDDPTGSGASHTGPWSVDLTTTVANSLLITCAEYGNSTITMTHGTGQDEQSDLAADGQRHGTSTEVKVAAGLETLTVNSDSGTPAGRFAAMAVEPFGGVTRRRSAPVAFR